MLQLLKIASTTIQSCQNVRFFEVAMIEDELVLPYAKQGLLGDVYETTRVLSESYDATGRVIKVRGLPGMITHLRKTIAAS
jgi:GTP-binding protein HflX